MEKNVWRSTLGFGLRNWWIGLWFADRETCEGEGHDFGLDTLSLTGQVQCTADCYLKPRGEVWWERET